MGDNVERCQVRLVGSNQPFIFHIFSQLCVAKKPISMAFFVILVTYRARLKVTSFPESRVIRFVLERHISTCFIDSYIHSDSGLNNHLTAKEILHDQSTHNS